MPQAQYLFICSGSRRLTDGLSISALYFLFQLPENSDAHKMFRRINKPFGAVFSYTQKKTRNILSESEHFVLFYTGISSLSINTKAPAAYVG